MSFDDANSNQSLKNEKDNSSFNSSEKSGQKKPVELTILPEYLELLIRYQHGEWDKCNALIDSLLESYPQEPELLKFKKDIETQTTLHQLHLSEEKEKKKNYLWQIFGLTAIFLIIVGVSAYIILNIQGMQARQISLTNEQIQQENLNALANQARQLLQAGKPEDALQIIGEIKSVDPKYPDIGPLTDEANILVKLDSMYTQSMQYIQSEKYEDALAILKQIDTIRPFYRDVKKQENLVENRLEIAKDIASAQKAYTEERWTDVINSYDQAVAIDADIITPEIKEQLLNSYLNAIISMMQNKDTKVEDVDQAEIYYRKALALFPRSSKYATERENLQKLSKDLIVFKYYQIAKQIINDPNPTTDSIGIALNYLIKASSLDPANIQLKTETDNAQIFQNAVTAFNTNDLTHALDQLSILSSSDSNYGNGKVKQLLFEANFARGKQYFDLGIYMDARVNFEAAENLAFGQTSNALQLYQVQLNLGYTLGKLRSYKDAASYFKYALNAIDINSRIADYPQFAGPLKTAESDFVAQKFLDAYNLYVDTIQAMAAVGIPYTIKNMDAPVGSNLAFIANANSSTITAIQEKNNLPKTLVLNSEKKLLVPYIK
jgi:tetratricopeptide (TPR) repeat protein